MISAGVVVRVLWDNSETTSTEDSVVLQCVRTHGTPFHREDTAHFFRLGLLNRSWVKELDEPEDVFQASYSFKMSDQVAPLSP